MLLLAFRLFTKPMRTLLFSTFFCAILNTAIGQIIYAGDVSYGISQGQYKSCTIEVAIYSYAPPPSLIVDWGDNTMDTIIGPTFEFNPGNFYSVYNTYHIYQDTGRYVFKCTSGNWVGGIANFEDSENQPFVVEAEFWGSYNSNFSNTISPLFSTSADIWLQENGVIRHVMAPNELDGDSIVQKLVPIPVPGYYFPEATDTLACCMVWDMPTMTGRYAFGIELEEWRFGQKMGKIQRFFSGVVDSVYSNSEEKGYLDDGFALYPNPTNNNLHILFKGAFIIGNNYILEIKDAIGRSRFVKPIDMMDYGMGMMVDVKDYPPGIYYVTLKNNHGSWTKKIVVGC